MNNEGKPVGRPWFVPAVVLLLLILAMLLRWEYNAACTVGGRVFKWKTDRWTGAQWVEIYDSRSVSLGGRVSAQEEPASKWADSNKRDLYTGIAGLCTYAVSAWLAWALYRTAKQRKPNKTE